MHTGARAHIPPTPGLSPLPPSPTLPAPPSPTLPAPQGRTSCQLEQETLRHKALGLTVMHLHMGALPLNPDAELSSHEPLLLLLQQVRACTWACAGSAGCSRPAQRGGGSHPAPGVALCTTQLPRPRSHARTGPRVRTPACMRAVHHGPSGGVCAWRAAGLLPPGNKQVGPPAAWALGCCAMGATEPRVLHACARATTSNKECTPTCRGH